MCWHIVFNGDKARYTHMHLCIIAANELWNVYNWRRGYIAMESKLILICNVILF